MSGNELVRVWKDPDEREITSYAGHPAGEIALEVLSGGAGLLFAEQAGDTVFVGNTCFLCVPEPIGF